MMSSSDDTSLTLSSASSTGSMMDGEDGCSFATSNSSHHPKMKSSIKSRLSLFTPSSSLSSRPRQPQQEQTRGTHLVQGTPQRVKTAARRMRLAFTMARTNAAAKRTLNEYYHHQQQQQSTEMAAQEDKGAVVAAAALSFSPTLGEEIIAGMTCHNIDQAMFSLYDNENNANKNNNNNSNTIDDEISSNIGVVGDDVNDDDDTVRTRSSFSCSYKSASFQLPLEYDALLDAEHPYSEQDLLDAKYWMEQLHPSHGSAGGVSWEESLLELLSQPQYRPLWSSTMMMMTTSSRDDDDDGENDQKLLPTTIPMTRYLEEKKDESNQENLAVENDPADNDDWDEDDFGDFQSAHTHPPLLTIGPSKDTDHDDGQVTLPRKLHSSTGYADDGDEEEIFLTPRQEQQCQPHQQQQSPAETSQLTSSKKSDNTEVLMERAETILQQKLSPTEFKMIPQINQSNEPNPLEKEEDDNNDHQQDNDDHLSLKTPELVQMTQQYLDQHHQHYESEEKLQFSPVSPPSSTSHQRQQIHRHHPSPTKPCTPTSAVHTPGTVSSPSFEFSPMSAFSPSGRQQQRNSTTGDGNTAVQTFPLLTSQQELTEIVALPSLDTTDRQENNQNEGDQTTKSVVPKNEPSRLLTHKASVTLPLHVNDLATLEGRWTRRRQMEKENRGNDDPKSMTQALKGLPVRDETIQVLHSLPWEYLAVLEEDVEDPYHKNRGHAFAGNGVATAEANRASAAVALSISPPPPPLSPTHRSPLNLPLSELDLWDQVTTDRLCKYDGLLDSVQREMCRRVDAYQVSKANHLIHAWDTNLRVAQIHYERAVQSLEQSMNGGSVGVGCYDTTVFGEYSSEHATTAIESQRQDESKYGNEGVGVAGQYLLLELWQARDDYKELDNLLGQLQSMFEIEQEIVQRIDTFDAQQTSALDEYRKVRALADQVNDMASQPSLASILCLAETRGRLATLEDRFWNRLRQQVTRLVTRVCRQGRTRPHQSRCSSGGGSLSCSSYSLMTANAKMVALQKQQQISMDDANTKNRTEFERLIQLQMDRNADWTEYERIIKAALDLKNVAVVGDAAFAADWSQTILQALSFEALRCFAVALLDPSVPDSGTKHGPSSVGSRFSPELAQLCTEVRHCLGDDDKGKLRQMCHNLVTIRFDFEASEFHFPRVYERLCDGLINILRMATDFVEFHQQHSSSNTAVDESDRARLVALSNALNHSLEPLWLQCENVLVQCLDEYLNFAGKRDLFSSTDDSAGMDDSVWLEDLSGLESVLHITENFLGYKSWLLDNSSCNISVGSMLVSEENAESDLFSRISQICQAHLRAVHVEAMTCTGKLLSKETWVLKGLKTIEENDVEGSRGVDILQTSLQSYLDNYTKMLPLQGPSSTNKNCTITDNCVVATSSASVYSWTTVYDFLDFMIPDTQGKPNRIVPYCISDNLVHWLARLILIAERLPVVTYAIGGVLENLFDLYVTTVLRLCSGNHKNERILIGSERLGFPRAVADDDQRSPAAQKRPHSPRIFFAKDRRRSKNAAIARPQVIIPPLLEVDICAPLLRDEPKFFELRKFVRRAQASLQGIVNLDRVDSWLSDPDETGDTYEMVCSAARVFEKRVAAAWSCFGLACLGDVAFSLLVSRVSKNHDEAVVEKKLDSLRSYFNGIALVTPTLVESAVLCSSVKAIGGEGVVSSIMRVASGWEECKLHEFPNDYVDDLCDRCGLVWAFVATSGKLPGKVMEYCWGQVIKAAYLCMLEGFARVPFCSTEGRALMTLDLASFSAGIQTEPLLCRLEKYSLLSNVPSVSSADSTRRSVDTYIKVFYYPQDEIKMWVYENFRDFKINHMSALVTKDFAETSGPDQNLQRTLGKLKHLYQSEILNND